MADPICIEEIKKIAAGRLKDTDVKAILDVLDSRWQAVNRAGKDVGKLEELMFKDAANLSRGLQDAALIEKRNRAINIGKKAAVDEFLGRWEKDPHYGLMALNVGVNDPRPGARASVDAKGHALYANFYGGIIRDLGDTNLKVVESRQMDREIWQALWHIAGNDEAKLKDLPGKAVDIARVFDKYQRLAMDMENRQGAWIRELRGYITRQTHDMDKIRRAGYEGWRDTVTPLLDAQRTLKGGDPEEVLTKIYQGLTTGTHLRALGAAEDQDLMRGFTGPVNLAKRISEEHRQVHFKDGDAAFSYNEKFGQNAILENVLGTLHHAARNVALMDTWGTNPRAMFDHVRSKLVEANADNPKLVDKLRAKGLDDQFSQIDGSTNIPNNRMGAKIAGLLRNVENMAKLGMVLISSFNDVPTYAAEFHRQGMKLTEAYASAFQNLIRGRGTKEQREIASLIGVGLEGIIGSVQSRITAMDSLPGQASKLMQRFFKYTGLNWWSDIHKEGIGLMMAHRLAQMKTLEWTKLDADTTRLLGNYGIDSGKWDLIRSVAGKEADGKEYVTPESVQRLTNNQVAPHVGIEMLPGMEGADKAEAIRIQRFKDELETSLRSYYTDRADMAILTPGAREMALLQRGTRPGTIEGEALRFVGQFKAFPMTMMTKAWGQDLHGKASPDILGIVEMGLGLTAMGYISMTAKEFLKGRDPRSLKDPSTWLAAVTQGGGFGIMGDFLFGEVNRTGSGIISSMAGPVPGLGENVIDIFHRAKAGKDPSATAFRTLLNNTPFINMFYTRMALDYLILHRIQEALNPGYLRRFERNIQNQHDQTFWHSPQDYWRP